jgi:hypothetical protein
MDAYDRCTNLGEKNLADIVAIYGRGQEQFRPPTYSGFAYQKVKVLYSCVQPDGLLDPNM